MKINLYRKGGKKIFVNESLLKTQREIKNYLRSVCFCSNDINIIKGEPNLRRIWLDNVVTQLEPVYIELLSRLNRILKQRSFFWRHLELSDNKSEALIESFDYQLALIGTRIFRRRKRALKKLLPYVDYWHSHLSKSKEKIGINYCSNLDIDEEDDETKIREKLSEQLLNQRKTESLRGKCSIGPHRDEVEFLINNISIRKFGSSGQQRTMILALKMAELDLLKNTILVPPILILDDVLADLDLTRQSLLLNSVGKHSQCLISATHLNNFDSEFVDQSQIIYL